MATGPTKVMGRRTIGFYMETIIDVVVLGISFALLGVRTKWIGGAVIFSDPAEQSAQIALAVVLYIIYWFATKVLTLGRLGWTPGMYFMGLRCVRWDGHPAGIPRAFVRTALFSLWQLAQCLFVLTAVINMFLTKTGQLWHDQLVGTFVTDRLNFGHLLVISNNGMSVGPTSVTREQAQELAESQHAVFEMPMDPRAKSGKPFFDNNLDTYVLWKEREQTWLAFDKKNGTWSQMG